VDQSRRAVLRPAHRARIEGRRLPILAELKKAIKDRGHQRRPEALALDKTANDILASIQRYRRQGSHRVYPGPGAATEAAIRALRSILERRYRRAALLPTSASRGIWLNNGGCDRDAGRPRWWRAAWKKAGLPF